MKSLTGAWTEPLLPPDPYRPSPDVIEWRITEDGRAVLELFARGSGTFGYRYLAWVAVSDAGDMVRGHLWHPVWPRPGLITDSLSEARQFAQLNAESLGLSFCGVWIKAV